MHNPFVPETLEGWALLHLMYRVRWDKLRGVSAAERSRLADEAVRALTVPDAGATAYVQLLGHKGDLLLIHAALEVVLTAVENREERRSAAEPW